MNPCPQCGAIPQPSDKFCNICGTPVVMGAPQGFGAPPPQQGGFGAPPPQQGGFGAPPPNAYGAPMGGGAPLRCQMGHDIAPGASYCPHGHPVALDAGVPFGAPPPQQGFGQPFGNDQYGGGYGQQPPPPQYGAPAGPGGFGAPPPQPGFPDPGYGQQPPPYPDPNAQFGGYNQQPGGFPPQQQPGFPGGQYAPPPPPQGFGAPPPQPGFGGPQPGFPAPGGPGGGFGGSVAPPGAAEAQVPAAAIPPNLPPNALRGFLVAYQSNNQGEFWALNGGRKTIGRANSGENVDIPLADATISSRHAALVIDGASGSISIEDTGSTNGTFVNEEHIGFNGKRELRDGDKVRFGGYTTIVKVIGRG